MTTADTTTREGTDVVPSGIPGPGRIAASPELPASSPAPPRPRLYALDGMRLLAALSVLLFHYLARGGNASRAWGQQSRTVLPGLEPVADYAWLGVEFFFIISGFVICMSCWGRTPGQFFRSRVTRLYPAYWTAIVLIIVAQEIYPVVVKDRMSFHDILLNLTMLHEPLGSPHVDGVFWTLWVEMRFYLLFAFVVWKGVNYLNTVVFCGLWTIASVIAVALDEPFLNTVLVPQYSCYFVAGIGFFLIHRFGSHILPWSIVGISWLIAQSAVLDETKRFSGIINTHLSGTWSFGIITLFFLAIAGIALGWFSWMNWRWLVTAGSLTYPLYLTHEHLGLLLIFNFRDQMSPAAVLVSVALCMLLLAWIIQRFIERPLARLLKRLLEQPLKVS